MLLLAATRNLSIMQESIHKIVSDFETVTTASEFVKLIEALTSWNLEYNRIASRDEICSFSQCVEIILDHLSKIDPFGIVKTDSDNFSTAATVSVQLWCQQNPLKFNDLIDSYSDLTDDHVSKRLLEFDDTLLKILLKDYRVAQIYPSFSRYNIFIDAFMEKLVENPEFMKSKREIILDELKNGIKLVNLQDLKTTSLSITLLDHTDILRQIAESVKPGSGYAIAIAAYSFYESFTDDVDSTESVLLAAKNYCIKLDNLISTNANSVADVTTLLDTKMYLNRFALNTHCHSTDANTIIESVVSMLETVNMQIQICQLGLSNDEACELRSNKKSSARIKL